MCENPQPNSHLLNQKVTPPLQKIGQKIDRDGDEADFLLFASGSEVEDQFSFFGFGLRI
jgi:hypothetical protein